jgi:hypothetical protein
MDERHALPSTPIKKQDFCQPTTRQNHRFFERIFFDIGLRRRGHNFGGRRKPTEKQDQVQLPAVRRIAGA